MCRVLVCRQKAHLHVTAEIQSDDLRGLGGGEEGGNCTQC